MSIFSKVSSKRPNSNIFDLSHDKKLSLDMGQLIPILTLECVPGDKISSSTSQMLRFAPLVAPMMHQVSVYTHFYFVPNRILWPNWEKFITGGEDGLDTTVAPFVNINGTEAIGTLQDYLGLPCISPSVAATAINALPWAGYQKIYNEYYRDENLVTAGVDSLIDGLNSSADLKLLRIRAWQHDYFTSALPWTQKGAEATIPLGTVAPVKLSSTNSPWIVLKASDKTTLLNKTSFKTDGSAQLQVNTSETVILNPVDTLEADLSTATAATINDLRTAFRTQEWLEKNARGGSRYIESILSHFGVRSSDARLQRPEFLGGGSSPMVISEVLQTSANTSEPTALGTQAGHGISVGASNSFSYTCEEHGYIIGIMSVLPKTAYQDVVPKHFLKLDKFDYFWPSFAHLGEQAIENQELSWFADGNNTATFGYTPRYSEYKFINSSVHGEYRSTLDFWHMGRTFASRPALNKLFIECVPTTRVFAVTTGEKLYAHVYHRIKARRLMPFFGTPTF